MGDISREQLARTLSKTAPWRDLRIEGLVDKRELVARAKWRKYVLLRVWLLDRVRYLEAVLLGQKSAWAPTVLDRIFEQGVDVGFEAGRRFERERASGPQ